MTLYFTVALVALPLAFAGVACFPRDVAGFFYHARMVALVHLVTLGWISMSILGALYLAGPMTLRLPMPARPLDYTAWGGMTVGLIGLVGHFWIAEFRGMAWSALLVALSLAVAALRILARVSASPVPRAIRLHIACALANILVAATMGVLVGFDKVAHFLPGYVLTNVFAHAHLAAIGWAGMMVVGMGYRLVPMVLPAAMPSGPTLYASLGLLETGAVGLFVALLRQSRWVPLFAITVVAGFAAFLGHVVWMRRRRRPAPVGRPRPDYAVLHVMAAFGYLALAALLGLWLSLAPPSAWTLRLALAYGVFGLVGFLAQMIVGMESRLLSLFAWYWAFAETHFRGPVPRPYQMLNQGLQRVVFACWTIGVPALAVGLVFETVPLVAAAGWILLTGALANSAHVGRLLRIAAGGATYATARSNQQPAQSALQST